MGIPIAVNFANIFMTNFEGKLIEDHKPVIWMRFVDDILFILDNPQEIFLKCVKFCDTFTLRSYIKITS